MSFVNIGGLLVYAFLAVANEINSRVCACEGLDKACVPLRGVQTLLPNYLYCR